MYAREVDGKKLTFSVSGMLWKRSLVMMDQETKSLWSHLLGEAMRGPLKGKQLGHIPSVMTDWKTWSEQHPQGSVAMLSRTSRNFTRQVYARPQQFVLGIVQEGKATAWSFELLDKNPALNEKLAEQPVLVVFDKASSTPRLYDRTVEQRVLTFRMQGKQLTDQETASTWEPVTGRAVAGPLKGKHLAALPAIVSFRTAWLNFHPKSEIKSP